MDFYIYVDSYDENSGGVIVLHRLCHIINSHTDHKAYLVPFRKTPSKKIKMIKERISILFSRNNYFVNSLWNTPVHRKWNIPSKGIVIYPEIISGNPLCANNVVRWLLHQPGYFSKKINYGEGELYFKFNSAIDDFYFPKSHTSNNYLKVIYYPVDIYNEDITIIKDIDTCYLVRKGHYKKMVHDTKSICIDGFSHEKTASVFKRSKRFICYDDYTAYSIFAALCGCESIVIPDPQTGLDEWYPDSKDRYGIAYGFNSEQLDWARITKHKLKMHIEEEHNLVIECVKDCIKEIGDYFQLV